VGQLTLLVLVLAVAAGLLATTLAAVLAQARRTAFLRAFLANILFFNLLIVLALVMRYLQIYSRSGLSILAVLVVMAVPKLAWAYAFVVMNRLLVGDEISSRLTRAWLLASVLLLALLLALLSWSVISHRPALVGWAAWVVEGPVILVALGAAIRTLVEAARLPIGPRRRSLAVFGGLHLGLLLALVGSILLGGLQPLVSGVLMILYNVLPLAWMRRYLPTGPESLAGPIERYGLTAREREIIELVCAGRTNQEIADRLFISLATVKDHNYNVFRKTGVRNRVELVNLFRDREPHA